MTSSGHGHDHGHLHGGHAQGHQHEHDDSGHGHGHGHGRGEQGHQHGGHGSPGLRGALAGLWHPHQHDHANSLDDALLADQAGRRALAVSLCGLLATGAIQAVIFGLSDSVGLLADTIHNLADALTALPIGLAFWAARRPATSRYTYGYGRAEDLAGLAVVVVMTVSAAVAAWQAIDRFIHPHQVHDLPWVAAAGVVGFIGNELAARYRIGVGTRIGSAALTADGRHARTDGFTSLAVVAGAAGVALGWPQADPVIGLLITVAILAVLRGAVRDIYRRLMDAVDPALTAQIERETLAIPAVLSCDGVRVRWIGHELHAELNITVDGGLTVRQAHDITEDARHLLLHHVSRLTNAIIHVNPPEGAQAHARTAHHQAARQVRRLDHAPSLE
ncbi:MAG: cation diffusion facilitator family transporter [Actinomycetia bacterium]|nr:cation diffusion facilitator family transporter [Actinomycetes bacterium]